MLSFHLDEHVARAIAKGLRIRSINVTTAVETGLLGANDLEHLAFALRTKRVIFTNDDFLVMAADQQQRAGIIYCQVGARSIGYVVDALQFFSDECEPPDMVNVVEYL